MRNRVCVKTNSGPQRPTRLILFLIYALLEDLLTVRSWCSMICFDMVFISKHYSSNHQIHPCNRAVPKHICHKRTTLQVTCSLMFLPQIAMERPKFCSATTAKSLYLLCSVSLVWYIKPLNWYNVTKFLCREHNCKYKRIQINKDVQLS